VLRTSKRPEPVNLVHCPSCDRHEPFCYSCRHRPTPKNTLRGNPGCAVGPKTPTVWLKDLCAEFCGDTSCIILFYDNQSAIFLTKDQMFHQRTKHIDIKYHYIREIVAEGKLRVCKISHISIQLTWWLNLFLELNLSFTELSWYNCLALVSMLAPTMCSFFYWESWLQVMANKMEFVSRWRLWSLWSKFCIWRPCWRAEACRRETWVVHRSVYISDPN
jgi:hypothetical protein